MRTYIYIAMLVFVSDFLQAQDTLYKADGSMHLAKILEVKDTQIKYKLFSNPDGPTYVIGKEYVSRIVYENGVLHVFPKNAADNLSLMIKIDPRATDFGRNFISVNVFDLFQGTVTVGYEYTFKSGLSSLKVPLSFKVANRESYFETKVFGIGLDYYLYPYGQGKSKFFFGPSFEYKKFESSYTNFEVNSAYAFLFQAGFLFQPSKHFNISVNAGLGYARLIGTDFYGNTNYGEVASRAGLNIGYKF